MNELTSSPPAEPSFKQGDVVYHRSLTNVPDPVLWVVTGYDQVDGKYEARTQTTEGMEAESFFGFELASGRLDDDEKGKVRRAMVELMIDFLDDRRDRLSAEQDIKGAMAMGRAADAIRERFIDGKE